MNGKDRIPVLPPEADPRPSAPGAGYTVDRLGLFAVFVDREDHAAIQHLFIEIDGRCRSRKIITGPSTRY